MKSRGQEKTDYAVSDFYGEIEKLTPLSDEAGILHSRMQEMLAEINEQQKSWHCLIDNLPAGVILMDSDFRILAVNRAYIKYFSEKNTLPLGEGLNVTLPLAEESGLMKLLHQVRDSKQALRVRNFRYEGFARGTTYWSGSIIPLKIPSEQGSIDAIAILALDVTDEVSARDTLTELAALAEERAAEIEAERSRLKAVLEAVPIPIFVYDKDSNVSIYNSAAVGLSQDAEMDEWLEKEPARLMDENNNVIDPADHPIARSLRGQSCTDEIVRYETNNGFRSFLINTSPLRDAHEDITGAVVAVTDITEQERARERIIEIYRREHYIADKLQRSFVPHELPQINGFEIAQHYLPALDEELVGGDFYDIFQLHEGRYGVVMADVSGKGLKAAVYTAMTKYMLRAYALRESDPKSVLARLNDALTSCTPPEVFVTLVYAIIDEQARTLVYANAGHEQPICYSHAEGFATTLDVTGPALGLISGARYLEHEVQLSQGDMVLLYTDGVTDAGSGADRMGHESVLQVIENQAGKTAQYICDLILNEAARYADGKLGDDAAMLLIRTI